MRDYKFRQSDLSLSKRKRTGHKALLAVAAVVLAAGALYAISQVGVPWLTSSQAPEGQPNTIPLKLPPRAEPEEETQPTDADHPLPAQSSATRPFSESTKDLQDEGQGSPLLAKAEMPVQAPEPVELTLSGEDTQPAKQAESPSTGTDVDKGAWIEHEVEPGDSLARIFKDNDLSPRLLRRILRSGKAAKHLKTIRPKDVLCIYLDDDRQFAALHYQLDALRSVEFEATKTGIVGTEIRRRAEKKATLATGVIEHTLFSSASRAGLPDSVTMQLTKIFGWDIDFALEIRPGDRFTVIYDELWSEGKQVGSGNVIAAEFVNQGHSYRAIRFKDGHGKADYYSPKGTPLKKAFFRTPVEFTRISSGFSNRRWHPLLKRWRAHKGVDYAAPSGTPVIATGDGTVEYRGWKKGYGRVVQLRHGRKYATLYGHLSRFAKGLRNGERVEQGKVIGYVGQSGLATGPHLHYEFRVKGIHRNPLAVKAAIADPLSPQEMKKFRKIAAPLLASLEQTVSDIVLAQVR